MPSQRLDNGRLGPETPNPGWDFKKQNYLDVKYAVVFPWLVKIFDAH